MFGCYGVSGAGGVFRSASAVASAATLAKHGQIALGIAATARSLASLTSVLIDLPLVWRISGDRRLTKNFAYSLGTVAALDLTNHGEFMPLLSLLEELAAQEALQHELTGSLDERDRIEAGLLPMLGMPTRVAGPLPWHRARRRWALGMGDDGS